MPSSLTAAAATTTDAATEITDLDEEKYEDMRFGKFAIPKTIVFRKSKTSAAFVNLRPIVPGHVLVMPNRIVPHLEDLSNEEYADLWSLVRTVQSVLKLAYEQTTAFNVAVQDGKAAGQSGTCAK